MQRETKDHAYYMKKALRLAHLAARLGEVPVGALLVKDGKILSVGLNLKEKNRNSLDHAELIALKRASDRLGAWRLEGCTLYVTLEPCPMCAGALVQSRIGQLIYGATDPKAGAVMSLYQITADPRLNHRIEAIGGIMDVECGQVLKDFFKHRRSENKQIP
ncbi:MAG: tRNA adenosine(34) deaminase TadA [Bdellovibrionota bacterium]